MSKSARASLATPALLRRLRALRKDAGRRAAENVFIAEGPHLAQAALDAGASLELALVSARLAATPEGAALREALARCGAPLFETAPSTLDALQDARTPQPVLVLARRHARTLDELLAGNERAPLLVIAWGIQDPGNLGALARTALAAGASGIVAVGGGADLFHPRAVRATAGALFRLPAAACAAAHALSTLRRHGVALVAADPAGGVPYFAYDFRGPLALLFGQEGNGLPPEALAQACARVQIPLQGDVESLSVGAAAAVLLFAAARQRQGPGNT